MQKRNKEALILVNETLNELIAESKAIWDREQDASMSFDEDTFLSRSDPSILHFLIASGAPTPILVLTLIPQTLVAALHPAAMNTCGTSACRPEVQHSCCLLCGKQSCSRSI